MAAGSHRHIFVVKRDASVERFDPCKLAAAIHRAMTNAGPEHLQLSRRLAEAVVWALNKTCTWRCNAAELRIWVRKVLERTGNAKVATGMAAYDIWREDHRRRCKVIIDPLNAPDTTRTWQKTYLVDMLRSMGLGRGSARVLASRIEQKILGADMPLVTWQLVEQYALSEMLSCGLCPDDIRMTPQYETISTVTSPTSVGTSLARKQATRGQVP